MFVKDPICGMEIEAEKAYAARANKDQTDYFCSKDCLKQFESRPGKGQPSSPSAAVGQGDGKDGKVRLELPVTGLNRSGGPALARVLKAIPGVSNANVNVSSGRAVIEYDPERVMVTDFIDAVRQAGFHPAGQSLRLKVSGLFCAECVITIENALKATPGVLDATMSAATNEVKIDYSPVIGDLKRLNLAIESAGP